MTGSSDRHTGEGDHPRTEHPRALSLVLREHAIGRRRRGQRGGDSWTWWWRRRLSIAVLLIAAPIVIHDGYVLQVVSLGWINAILAMGVVLSYGRAGVPNMSQGTISGIGGYAAADLMIHFGLPFPLALVGAALCGAFAGGLLGSTTARVKGTYWWLITIAFTQVMYIVFNTWTPLTGGESGLVGIPIASIGPLKIDSFRSYYYLGLVAMMCVYLVYALLNRSRAGIAIRAVGRDEVTAMGLGLAPTALRISAMTLAGIGAGIGGACFAVITGYISAGDFTLTISFQTMLFAIVGGITSLGGSIVASVALTYLTTAVASLVNDQLLIIGGVVLVALLARSYGVNAAMAWKRLQILRLPGQARHDDAGDAGASGGTLTALPVDDRSTVDGQGQVPEIVARPVTGSGAGAAATSVDPSCELLVCSELGIVFGGVTALEEVELVIGRGEIVGLIGPNGSGKTTLVNVISGYYRPSVGRVSLGGMGITGRRPQEIHHLGISRVFQNVRLYGDLTVTDNVVLGMLPGFNAGWNVSRSIASGIFRRDAREVARLRSRARDVVTAAGLGAVSEKKAGELSYGQRKEIELLRAIALPPRVLLLDEPTSGISDQEAESLKERLMEWHAQFGFAVLVVEHRHGWLFDVATRVVVLNEGRVIASGPAQEVASSVDVWSAYVGS